MFVYFITKSLGSYILVCCLVSYAVANHVTFNMMATVKEHLAWLPDSYLSLMMPRPAGKNVTQKGILD